MIVVVATVSQKHANSNLLVILNSLKRLYSKRYNWLHLFWRSQSKLIKMPLKFLNFHVLSFSVFIPLHPRHWSFLLVNFKIESNFNSKISLRVKENVISVTLADICSPSTVEFALCTGLRILLSPLSATDIMACVCVAVSEKREWHKRRT